MEHLIRILNDDDRQTLAWLRTHVGDSRLADAAKRLAAHGLPVKPYLSAVCRYLGVWPPAQPRAVQGDASQAVADQHIAQMRLLLARHSKVVHRTTR
ncbi:hypothetical protein [Paraburkholderia sp. Ac-20347]|uniref:hypothetical protein n=1 Tax=Paraburkholderia sp. Ac-20347 TaxID=2703892 RepID=UPI00197D4D68|nr:hypothetical protein [Paraburkholderia sp. Ac-20347]MBN3808528.1 hypothetical protein [Paraburkholderia sp. Ac-20347]